MTVHNRNKLTSALTTQMSDELRERKMPSERAPQVDVCWNEKRAGLEKWAGPIIID